MEQTGAQTIATFNGILLKRDRALEDRFVRLVFRENDKNWLCVSTDPRTAALPVGQSYRIEGVFKERGEQAIVYNPKIAELKKHWRPIRRVIFVVALVACVAGLGGVAYMHQHGDSGIAAQNANVTTPRTTPVASHQTTAPTQPTSAPTAPSAAPVVTSAPVITTAAKKTTKSVARETTVSSGTSPKATVVAAVAAPTDNCTTQSIPFTSMTTDDPTQPIGTVTQTGVDGSEQVCTVSGIAVTAAMVPQITVVGTLDPAQGS